MASSHGNLWLEKHSHHLLLRHSITLKLNHRLNCQIELYNVLVMRKALRLFLGVDWQPELVTLACQTSPYRFDDDLTDVTEIGTKSSGISIPDFDFHSLHLPQDNSYHSTSSIVENLLNTMIGLEHLNINLVATQLGLSQRTLQRMLDQEGGSFRELKRKASINKAQYLLSRYPQIPNDELAFACGYTAYSNFHRAFVAEAGITPSQSRKSNKKAPCAK